MSSKKRERTGSQIDEPGTAKKSKQHVVAPVLRLTPGELGRVLSFLTLEETFRSLALGSKMLSEQVHCAFTEISLLSDATHFDTMMDLVNLVSRLKRLEKLQMDGFDELSDAVVRELFAKSPPSLKSVHIRQCGIVSPRIECNSIETLQISLCQQLHKLRIYSTSIRVLELYDCEIAETPKFLTPELQMLKFVSCVKLTDQKLYNVLKQFDENPIVLSSSQQQQQQHSQNSPPRGIPADKLLFVNKNLKTLWVSECEPLENPIIKLDTLEDLRLINVRTLRNPLIRCIHLRSLQLNWCENLENLVLGCDNLKRIDLTGAGVNSAPVSSQYQMASQGEMTVRDNIVASLQRHFGEQQTSITF